MPLAERWMVEHGQIGYLRTVVWPNTSAILWPSPTPTASNGAEDQDASARLRDVRIQLSPLPLGHMNGSAAFSSGAADDPAAAANGAAARHWTSRGSALASSALVLW